MPPAELPPDLTPRLRPGLAAAPNGTPDTFALFDPNRLTPGFLTLTRRQLGWVQLFTGEHTLADLRRLTGTPADELSGVVAALDGALFLDGPAFRDYLTGPVRKPACIGCYPEDPAAVRAQLRRLFTGPGGPGLPDPSPKPSPHGRLRAALLPHMDYTRGGVTYGWGFKELVEQTDARLFVIVATSHYSPHRFTLTRMNFETPLGVAETDRSFVDRLEREYGDGLFDDPFAHLPEHSIELEVVLLQYLLEGRRPFRDGRGLQKGEPPAGSPFRIVPLLCGSYFDCLRHGIDPADAPDVARMIAALRAAEAAAGEPVCYLISGDLAHIGPKFGDPDPVSDEQLAASKKQDEALLDRLAAADADGYYKLIAAERDERRICGLPPTWLTLQTVRPRIGQVLKDERFVHPDRFESVSFAAAAFYE